MQTRRLYRSRTDTKIAGVCGGMADHFDTDPVFIRLAFVGLTLLAPPAGILGYLACWLIIPEEPPPPPAEGEPPGADPEGDPGAGPGPAGPPRPAESASSAGAGGDGALFAGALLIAVGVLFLLLNLGFLDWSLFRFWRWRVVWPLAVIFLGAVIIYRALRPSGREGES